MSKIFFISILLIKISSVCAKEWSFIVMSDIHVYGSGTVPSKFKKMVSHVLEKKPEIIFITGDHTSGNKGDKYNADQIQKWYSNLDIALKPLYDAGIMIVPTVGNHDFYERKHKDAYITWATKTLKRSQGKLNLNIDNPLYFNFEYKGQEFFIMKFWTYLFDKDQKAWFESQSANPPKNFRFAYGHVPLKSIRGRTTQSFYSSVLGSFIKGNIEIYFSGHEHMHWDEYLPSSPYDLRQLTVGTTSGTYNHPIRSQAREEHCKSRYVCTMPATQKEFKIESRKGKDGYQVHRQNFVEVKFSGAKNYTIKSYSMDKEANLIDFYL